MKYKSKRGRPKGWTKEAIPTIKDELINPYIIYVEDNSYSVYDYSKSNNVNKRGEMVGYYSSLSSALGKIAKLKISAKEHTLQTYIKELKTITEQLINSVTI